MKDRAGWVFKGLAGLLLIFALVLTYLSLAELLMPETGKTVKKSGKMVVDCSHMDEGYIMVRANKSKKKLKVRISCDVNKEKIVLNYNLNGNGDFEVFPLQFGNRKYAVTLYQNIGGKKYSQEGQVGVKPNMADERRCFLYPNQYVNYDANTACVREAMKMCEGMTEQTRIYQTICDYVKGHFVYDFIKSVTVQPGTLPDIDGCWEKNMGICQDLSAMMIAMLRSQGIPARLTIGTLGSGTYHAWVTAYVNGEEQFYDPTVEVNAGSRNETYTTERFY